MGLDMYLEKRTYVKNWSHMTEAEKTSVAVERNGAPIEHIKAERVKAVVEDVAYWRKANAIHRWFVINCQGGEDDCRSAWVSSEQLGELVAICNRLLNELRLEDGKVATGISYANGVETPLFEDGLIVVNPEVAKELLPTEDGFFFGGTGYDHWYVETLRDTVAQIEPALAENSDADFYYQSSW